MSGDRQLSAEVLRIDPAAACAQIAAAIREAVLGKLRRKGAVLGLSGGVDSATCAALAVRALGPDRVLGLLMPEAESDPDSLRLGRAVAEWLGLRTVVEDVAPILRAAGCYQRRDAAIERLLPGYDSSYRLKLVMSDVVATDRYPVYWIEVESPQGERRRARLSADEFLAVVAATNFKQRVRKMMEYYYADRYRYAVVGTPNRLEYDQGFFVKNGDGAADLKPIAHLYKTQVYALAEHLGAPREICEQPPTTGTFSLPQTQQEFFFALPYPQMDLCLYAKDHGYAPEEAAEAVGLTAEQVRRVYRMIEAKRRAAEYLHAAPLLVEKEAGQGAAGCGAPLPEIGRRSRCMSSN